MGIESADDGIQERIVEIGRMRELFLAVGRRLPLQGGGFQWLAANHRADIRKLVVIAEFPAEQLIELGDLSTEPELLKIGTELPGEAKKRRSCWRAMRRAGKGSSSVDSSDNHVKIES
jgi:hypothetical protein